MRKDGIINIELLAALTALEHTDSCVIGDAGLPVPDGVKLIDLTLIRGKPSFEEVLHAVMQEITLESYVIASETASANPHNQAVIDSELSGYPKKVVSHEELKELSKHAKFVVRTGEVTPYSNIILISSSGF